MDWLGLDSKSEQTWLNARKGSTQPTVFGQPVKSIFGQPPEQPSMKLQLSRYSPFIGLAIGAYVGYKLGKTVGAVLGGGAGFVAGLFTGGSGPLL